MPGRFTAPREGDREAAISRLFHRHYAQLVRLAIRAGAGNEAEDIVEDAFCVLHRRWQTLRDSAAAPAFLRAVVCNLARMHLRHEHVVRRRRDDAQVSVDSAEAMAERRADRLAVLAALRRLPGRQREALVLRYWLGLGETSVAHTMGISRGAVKAHTARGMAGMRRALIPRP